MAFAIIPYGDCDFDILTNRGELYGYHQNEEQGVITETSFILTPDLEYDQETIWDLASDSKQWCTDGLPLHSTLDEAIAFVIAHLEFDSADRISLHSVNLMRCGNRSDAWVRKEVR